MNLFSKKIYYLIAAIIVVLVVYLMRDAGLKFDLSKGKSHTLSQSTKSVLHNLKEPVTVTFYASSALPSRLQPTKRDVSDLLSEYKKEGRNKIVLVVKDPKKDEKTKKEAEATGIPELNFSQQEQDRFAVTSGFFGVGLAKGDKKAALPQVADIGDLEYNLTSAIYKISSKELPKIGVMGADSKQQQFNTLGQVSTSQFDLTAVATPDASIKALLVVDNRSKEYTNEEVQGIEKYINGGGKAIFMTDGVWISNELQASKATHNLYNLLKKYGITLHENLVMSTAAEVVNFGGNIPGSQLVTAYPYWLRTQSFDKSNAFFSNVRQLTFPWTSSLTLGTPSNIKVTSFAQSAGNSWEQTQDFTLSPQTIKQPNPKDFKQFTLISTAEVKNGGKLLVIPTSRFVDDQFLSRTSDNLEFVLNVMSDYAAGGALSGIRQRSVDLYPIPPDLSNQQKDLFKYLTILLLPALFAAYGIFRLVRRK